MSLINEKDILYQEKEALFKLVINNKDESFLNKASADNSYFISYSQSKHAEKAITEYNSEDFLILKEKLTALWSDAPNLSLAIPIIMKSYMDSQSNPRNMLKEVDLFNYMM